MIPYRWRRRALWTLGLAAVVTVLAVALAALIDWVRTYQPAEGAEPPKVTDWLQAWGSVAAVAAGLIAALFTGALLWNEMRQARYAREALAEERRDAEMAQARLVVLNIPVRSWGNVTSRDEPGAEERSGAYLASVGGVLHNYSSAPIFDAVIELTTRAGDHADLPHVLQVVQIVGREDRAQIGARLAGVVGVLGSTKEEAEGDVCFVVRFTDAAGLRWVRRDNGQPQRAFA